VFEHLRLTSLIFPRYILNKRLYYANRAVGPFLSSPMLGTWLTVAAVAAVVLRNHASPMMQKLLLAVLPLFAVGEYATKTRSGWLGFVVAVPLALYLGATRVQRRMLAFVGASVVFFVALLLGERFFAPDRGESQATVAYSTNQRLALLQRSVTLFLRRPILGWGVRFFESASRTESGGGPLEFVDNDAGNDLAAHNTMLRVAVENGLVGITLLLSLFWYWFQRSRQAILRLENGKPGRDMAVLFLGAFVAYLCEATFHDVTFTGQENLLVWFLAGCLTTFPAGAAVAGAIRRTPASLRPMLGPVHVYPAFVHRTPL
jgi:O-antigen ligase